MIKPVTLRQIFVLLVMCILTLVGTAQDNPLQAGDPPLSHLINVATVDDVTVNVAGEAGAVFASAGVIVQNLYTGATVTTIATGNGSFEIAISGTDRMPYQVNAIRTLPQTMTVPLPGVGTIVYPDYSNLREGQPIPFGIGGQLSYGANVWFAEGHINQLNFNAGDALILTMNVRLFVPDADPTLPYTMRGQIALRRLFDENGRQLSTAIGAGDDWSSELTPTGLPILGRHVPDTVIAEDTTERLFVDEETGELGFRFNFLTTIPDDLPAGLYVPVFTGHASIADSESFDWYANRVFSTDGDDIEGDSSTVLGLPMRVGEVSEIETVWVVADELPSHQVQRYNTSNLLGVTDTSVVKGIYQLSPRLLGLTSPVPLIPITTGQLSVSIVDFADARVYENIGMNLPAQVIVEDEEYYLYVHQPVLAYDFNLDATSYVPIIEGYAEDIFGNRYKGGGQYGLDTKPSNQLSSPKILTDNPFDYYRAFNPLDLSSTLANGVMGLADYDRNPQAWFDTRSYPTDAPDVPAFVNFPYFQGDVVFVPDGADAGLNPVLTGGEYQYLSIVRPDVTVRQFVRDSAATFDARVSNDDLLGGQIGAGSAGNRPGDVMFLFGGTVAGEDIRGYSALAVVTNEDSARVVPPFTEPLFTIRDEPYYMFVLPTGVRPGQVLEVGNTFPHVGYVAPTVAANVYTEIIIPSGEVIQNETTASLFGYFYEPSHDFTVTESGVYRVFTQASYNGITSAGQLSRTFTGHPLGAEEYYVFVVPEGEPMLTTPRENISTVTSGQTFTINVRAPEDWTNVNAYYVVRTASTILEQGTLDIFANQTNYNFEWGQISRTFPNIESAAIAPSDMDEITFSFAMTGLDANGNPVIRARLFTLRGNTLYTFGE